MQDFLLKKKKPIQNELHMLFNTKHKEGPAEIIYHTHAFAAKKRLK